MHPTPPAAVRSLLLVLALALGALLVPAGFAQAGAVTAGTPSDDTMLTVPPAAGSAPVDTANDFIDLERDLSECVGNSLSKPGCGREPTHSGDRGSAMQWAVFGLMAAGIAFIGWRIVSGARRTRPTGDASS